MNLTRAGTLIASPVISAMEVKPTLLSRGHTVFLRVLALVFVFFALRVWMEAVGLDDPDLRFDTAGRLERVYLAVLAVLLPVAAVGLWTTLSWGRVVWLLTISFQMAAGWLYPQDFPAAAAAITFHLLSLVLYIGFALGVRITAKKG